jgi:DNA replication and repair protein RecF
LSEAAAPAPFVARLAITDFRCFSDADVELTPGVTVLRGANGQGKTSVLEAVAWPARARSIRGVPDAALVRRGADVAVLRCDVHDDAAGRRQTFAAEIRAVGRNRLQLNGQHVARTRDLFGFLRVTVFAPDDLALVKGGPAERRDYLDDLLQMLAPRYVAAASDYDHVLRQRNALLKRAPREGVDTATLAVFDDQLVAAGSELVRGRLRLLERLRPVLVATYRALGEGELVEIDYIAEWAHESRVLGANDAEAVDAQLRDALARRRTHELDRQLTLVGPHRDELRVQLAGLDARTQASQGEQRSLALALRLAGHAVVTDVTGVAPVLLLDDVFSELDARRAAALVALLPRGQTLLTTATSPPTGVHADRELVVEDAKVIAP